MGDSFSHHGILGMRWGIRRFQNPDGTLTDLGKKRYNDNDEDDDPEDLSEQPSEEYAKSRENIKRDKKYLTNSELRELNERLTLESNYAKLTSGTSSYTKAKKAAKEVLEASKMILEYREVIGKYSDWIKEGKKATQISLGV